jgi:hypothetical protein
MLNNQDRTIAIEATVGASNPPQSTNKNQWSKLDTPFLNLEPCPGHRYFYLRNGQQSWKRFGIATINGIIESHKEEGSLIIWTIRVNQSSDNHQIINDVVTLSVLKTLDIDYTKLVIGAAVNFTLPFDLVRQSRFYLDPIGTSHKFDFSYMFDKDNLTKLNLKNNIIELLDEMDLEQLVSISDHMTDLMNESENDSF